MQPWLEVECEGYRREDMEDMEDKKDKEDTMVDDTIWRYARSLYLLACFQGRICIYRVGWERQYFSILLRDIRSSDMRERKRDG